MVASTAPWNRAELEYKAAKSRRSVSRAVTSSSGRREKRLFDNICIKNGKTLLRRYRYLPEHDPHGEAVQGEEGEDDTEEEPFDAGGGGGGGCGHG